MNVGDGLSPQFALTIDKLVVRYGAIEALHGVSLKIPRGGIVCLIGANGAGKTTLLRAISGLIPAAAGKIEYWTHRPRGVKADGEDTPVQLDLRRTGAHEIVASGLSQVPEGRGVFATMTVRENLELGAYLRRDAAGIREDYERALQLFPRLRERLAQTAGTLSGGEQQMLAIGRALMSRPSTLLLDEPSLGLAPILVEQIFEVVRTIHKQGTTVLLVEQNAHMALQVAQYAYVLETGQIALEGPAAEVACNDQVRKSYLGE